MADPAVGSLKALRAAEAACTRCPLYRNATQVVPGEGPARARVMMVGEQPGDQEDKQGHPFVGPAGGVLRRALEEVGVDPGRPDMPSAVKHFRWEWRGKRRIHKPPSQIEIVACQPWFAAELDALTPQILVLLGSVAAKSVFGAGFRVTRERGQIREGPKGLPTMATVHPSSVLRSGDDDRRRAMEDFARDLAVAAQLVAQS